MPVILDDSDGGCAMLSDSDSDFDDTKAENGKRRSKNSKKNASTKSKKQKTSKDSLQRCHHCRQRLVDNGGLVFYESHPEGAVDEAVALTDPSLLTDLLDRNGECELDDFSFSDPRPELRLTQFTFFDDAGHVVGFDWEMLDSRSEAVYFSGYCRAITDHNPLAEGGGVAVCDGGPLTEWWISGYGPEETPVIGVSTDYAHYYLTEATEMYRPFMNAVREKALLSKIVVECLTEAYERREEIQYEDLLAVIEGTQVPDGLKPFSEDMLVNHAAFVVAQVTSYEDAGDEDEDRFMVDAPCMRNLISLTGTEKKSSKKAVRIRGGEKGAAAKAKAMPFSKATTTPLVRELFEECFAEQIDKSSQEGKNILCKSRKRRCNVCENCLAKECGTCSHCKDMVKFGGTGKSKQACVKRTCSNMVERDVDQSISEDELELEIEEKVEKKFVKKQPNNLELKKEGGNQMNIRDCFIKIVPLTQQMRHLGFKWVGQPLGERKGGTFYSQVLVGQNEKPWSIGDFVYANDEEICQIVYLYEKRFEHYAHLRQYIRGTATLLEETSDKNELFQLRHCYTSKLGQLDGKANVCYWPTPDNWATLGGTNASLAQPPPKNSYFYRMKYIPEHARFEKVMEVKSDQELFNFCQVCHENEQENVQAKVKLLDLLKEEDGRKSYAGFVYVGGVTFKIGDAIFYSPKNSSNSAGVSREQSLNNLKEDVDHQKYPEYYRKNGYQKGSNQKTPPPFDIGIIKEVTCSTYSVRCRVQCLLRPGQTCLAKEKAFRKDLNYLYWTQVERNIDAETVQGKCYVRAEQNIMGPLDKWTEEGEFRFYYNEMYEKREFKELPMEAEKYGKEKKGGGKGLKGTKGTKLEMDDDGRLPEVTRPLRGLDVFAGCGGLSHGLHQAGVAESKWAIEVFEPAAKAYKKNNPECVVFTDDCNVLLKKAIEAAELGQPGWHCGKQLPQKGDVELLCGGPPCQGFSGMNRFNEGEYSNFKNSLISSYLSYCDFYRPRFFILENVRNFASFKKSVVLKLCLRALIKMGYQCTFGILQAGNFGVAQTRRRCILLAAAPDEKLPLYPEPQHTFAKTSLCVKINEDTFLSNCRWTESAPYRTITVRDIMSDLPPIVNGDQEEVMDYEVEPESPFQRMMRGNTTTKNGLRDHMVKRMNALVEARMSLIPTSPGADWRDLPNIVFKLSSSSDNGSAEYTQKLVYAYNDVVQGKAPGTKALRGVCHCAEGKNKRCVNPDKQENTLIPWCLPHTSNRHNHWAGLYGRVAWDGFFSTTVTNPEPMGKQGRVLHPEQHRLVSVRECARSQGFPDCFHFYGTVLEKHRQIGNAVPPPMGKALGLEIRKAAFGTSSTSKVEVKEEEGETDS